MARRSDIDRSPENPLTLLLRGIREVGLKPTWAGVRHAVRTRWIEAKFADPDHPLRGLPLLRAFFRRLSISPTVFPPSGPVVRTPGLLHAHTLDGPTLTCAFDHAVLTLTAAGPGHLRVRVWPLRGKESEEARKRGNLQPAIRTLRLDRLTCTVSPEDGCLSLHTPDGDPIAEEVAPVGWTAEGRVLARWHLPADAHCYGLGQRTLGLDLRGRVCVNWNTDPRTYDAGDDPVNLCVPFLLILHDGGRQGYGLFLRNTARSRFDLGATDPTVLTVEVEDETLEYDLFYGPSLIEVLRQYTEATGRPPLFPLWSLGYHQSRWSYYPESRVRRLARDFREIYQVPCDAVHLDIHYMDGYRCFTWDSERFPDPASLVADLHAQGFKVVTIIDPGVKADRGYWVFREGLERGVFCRYPDGKVAIGPVWPGDCAFPDFTDPEVRTWWGDLHRTLVEVGVDGIWDDMNEPSLFGEDGATLPGPVRHDLDGRGGDHRRAHNVYGLSMARATYEGLLRLRPDRRPFVLTRSGWAGVQRYAAHWTGDNRSTWESLRLTVPMVLGLGLSGIPFTGADIGGFAGFATGELFTRWLQLGVFLPFFRAHTVFDSPDQEPWSWGEPYLTINRETIRLRYRLLPYLYTALWQAVQTGLPIARPLFLAFQDDPATHSLEDQFLCGDALLVAPILEEGANGRAVYLPAGLWYDFWTDDRYAGPARVKVEAPLDRIPVFVRAGSVIPMGPEMEHVGQRSACSLTLHVYPGEGESRLYEDDGETFAYRTGAYRLTQFEARGGEGRIDLVRKVEGNYPGCDRFVVVAHGVGGEPEVAVDGVNQASYSGRDRPVRIETGPFHILSVRW